MCWRLCCALDEPLGETDTSRYILWRSVHCGAQGRERFIGELLVGTAEEASGLTYTEIETSIRFLKQVY